MVTSAGTAATDSAGVTHMLVLNPPTTGLALWSPWRCICGVGASGGDEAGARRQYELHVQGLWPAWSEPIPGSHPVMLDDGSTIWVLD